MNGVENALHQRLSRDLERSLETHSHLENNVADSTLRRTGVI